MLTMACVSAAFFVFLYFYFVYTRKHLFLAPVSLICSPMKGAVGLMFIKLSVSVCVCVSLSLSLSPSFGTCLLNFLQKNQISVVVFPRTELHVRQPGHCIN